MAGFCSLLCVQLSVAVSCPAINSNQPLIGVHVRLKLQYLQEVELSSTEPEARRSDGRNDRRSLGGCSGSLGIDEFPRSAIPAAADDCAIRGLATAALSGGWARPLLPFLAVGPAFWIPLLDLCSALSE